MRQWTVDAFASAPFRGNPACVLEPFDAWPDAAWMQALAAENNQAETAYLLTTGDPARFHLRWFTPAKEAPLCGHATLAAAHILYTELGSDSPALTFDTLSGPLIVSREGAGYAMDFPADPPRRTGTPNGLADALGAAPHEVWAGAYLVAVLRDEAEVRGLTPDLAALVALGGEASGGPGQVIVCAAADAGSPYDVVDRFFAPAAGIPEDPATGSAHCILAPLYAEKLVREVLKFHQAYPGRGGDIDTRLQGDRVVLLGEAVTLLESRLRFEP